MVTASSSVQEVSRRWMLAGEFRPAPAQGLINRTWLVDDPPKAVLQWVNPIIDRRANHDIVAVTKRLNEVGMLTPRLIKTVDGMDFVPDDSHGCWRVLSYIPGKTLERIRTVEQGHSLGKLVGRFHQHLADWRYSYRAPPRHAHDTEQRMQALQHAIDSMSSRHPLGSACRALGHDILSRWAEFTPTVADRVRNCHGDLKVSNIRFDDSDHADALIDLDTVGLMEIDSEMGDAWRSWCCSGPEDDPAAASFDLDIFAATAAGWFAEVRFLEANELRCLVPSIERICLELAARFCADALLNTYFREDRARFPEIGTHNLARARTQFSLAHRARCCRRECEDILASLAATRTA